MKKCPKRIGYLTHCYKTIFAHKNRSKLVPRQNNDQHNSSLARALKSKKN